MKKKDEYKMVHDNIIEPGDFVFDPACGTYNPQERNVAVSGYVIPYRQIDQHGGSYTRLSEVFRKIDARTKKKRKNEKPDDRSEFERAVDEVNKK